jgi:hypothetical protein
MDIDSLLPPGGLQALAGQLGVSPEQARQGAEGLLPSILAGMGDKAGGPQAPNADALEQHLSSLGGPALADNVTGPQPTDVDKGNQILGHIFGSKDVSRQVAGRAAQSSGLAPELLKKMLPILVMLVAGQLAKRSSAQGGGLGGILGSVLGAAAAGGGGLGGALGGMLGSSGGGGGLGGMLGSILGGAR